MDDRPPIGLTEDEAYQAPAWVAMVIVIASLFLFLMAVALVINGIMVAFDVLGFASDWSFWGNTYLFGALLVVAGVLMLWGLVMLDRGRISGLATLFGGVILFELVMLRAVLVTTSETSRLLYFLVMLLVFLLMLPFQLREVRLNLVNRRGPPVES